MNVTDRIKKQLTENSIVLYMKGTPEFPQCGFSHKAVQILSTYNVPYFAVNVLDDHEIREGIKIYGNWPTLPQLYVKGQLVGGCDIMSELHGNGELQAVLSSLSSRA